LVGQPFQRGVRQQLVRAPRDLHLHVGSQLRKAAAGGSQVALADEAPGADEIEVDFDLQGFDLHCTNRRRGLVILEGRRVIHPPLGEGGGPYGGPGPPDPSGTRGARRPRSTRQGTNDEAPYRAALYSASSLPKARSASVRS